MQTSSHSKTNSYITALLRGVANDQFLLGKRFGHALLSVFVLFSARKGQLRCPRDKQVSDRKDVSRDLVYSSYSRKTYINIILIKFSA